MQAAFLTIHGSDAILTDSTAETLLVLNVPSLVKDLELRTPGLAINLPRGELRNVRITAARGVEIGGPVKITDTIVTTQPGGAVGVLVLNGGTLTWDRGQISGGVTALQSFGTATIDVSNLLAFATSDVAINLSSSTTGTIGFSTVADSGGSSTTASAVVCSSAQVQIRSSILWTPNTARSPVAGMCNLNTVIAGPPAVGGASNVDPRFVNETNHDYHLDTNSPARDMVDSGPALDFEADARPAGVRFDLGADEAL
ncbi:MAG TPA: hypothetical protein VFQ53_05480 [Kofleriaceae bacterium]|nr:hypothetical protein [Kofleriaceae bacterium]